MFTIFNNKFSYRTLYLFTFAYFLYCITFVNFIFAEKRYTDLYLCEGIGAIYPGNDENSLSAGFINEIAILYYPFHTHSAIGFAPEQYGIEFNVGTGFLNDKILKEKMYVQPVSFLLSFRPCVLPFFRVGIGFGPGWALFIHSEGTTKNIFYCQEF